MSTKKEKYLESAQKFIVKGQVERAIREYEQVVALDPKDLRHRQRLAELLVRVNRKEEAIGEYETIGRNYADNAYYLKAIAVYKQIQRLAPDDLKTTLTLASLNEKQGLTGNALAEYNLVCSQYEKTGSLKEILPLLEKMLSIDPENLATQLKFAETHYASGQIDKAYEEFTQLALLLQKRGDETAFNRMCDRIQQLFPDKSGFIMDLLVAQIEKGHAVEAIPRLQGIIRKDTANLKAWRLLTRAYLGIGDTGSLKQAYRHMLRLFPDDASVWEGIVRCALDEGDAVEALNLLESLSSRFIAAGDTLTPVNLYQRLLEIAPNDRGALQGLASVYASLGDTQKLAELQTRLAEASRVQEPEPEPEPPPFVEEFPAGPVTPAVAPPIEPEPAAVWEEEIDLSILEEAGLHEPQQEADQGADVSLANESAPLGYGDEEAVTAGTPPATDAAAEVSLELDFCDEVAGAGWLDETPAATEAGGQPSGESALPVSDDTPLPFADLEEDEFFNLGEELLAETFEEEPQVALKQDKYSLDGLFSEFKKGLDQQLDKGDTETHYNLGIAYKEMGLFDDAISEFRAAAMDPQRRVDCLTLEGICCRDKGDIGMAEELFQAGIAMEGIATGEMLSLKYELAMLYEQEGRIDDAIRTYQEVQSVKTGFRDAARKIAELQGTSTGELEELELVELEMEEAEQ